MSHYEDLGYTVEDTRYGNSYDALATKDGVTIYLEAKGTVGTGDSVIVSRGEIRWALAHPGQCVLGVLSEIELTEDGGVFDNSGVFRIFEWHPEDDEIDPRVSDWMPNPTKQVHP